MTYTRIVVRYHIMKPINQVAICKACGKPIYTNEVYIQQVGSETGPWHHYDCRKKRKSTDSTS